MVSSIVGATLAVALAGRRKAVPLPRIIEKLLLEHLPQDKVQHDLERDQGCCRHSETTELLTNVVVLDREIDRLCGLGRLRGCRGGRTRSDCGRRLRLYNGLAWLRAGLGVGSWTIGTGFSNFLGHR